MLTQLSCVLTLTVSLGYQPEDLADPTSIKRKEKRRIATQCGVVRCSCPLCVPVRALTSVFRHAVYCQGVDIVNRFLRSYEANKSACGDCGALCVGPTSHYPWLFSVAPLHQRPQSEGAAIAEDSGKPCCLRGYRMLSLDTVSTALVLWRRRSTRR